MGGLIAAIVGALTESLWLVGLAGVCALISGLLTLGLVDRLRRTSADSEELADRAEKLASETDQMAARAARFEAEAIAARLSDPQLIAKARVFPYQIMAAYHACSADVPPMVRDALQDALEIALGNVPQVEGKVVVCPDVSGSMSSAVYATPTSSTLCASLTAMPGRPMSRANCWARSFPVPPTTRALCASTQSTSWAIASSRGSLSIEPRNLSNGCGIPTRPP